MEYRQTRAGAAAPVIAELPKRVLNVLEFAFTLLWTAGWISVSLALQLVSGRPDRALNMARTRWAPVSRSPRHSKSSSSAANSAPTS